MPTESSSPAKPLARPSKEDKQMDMCTYTACGRLIAPVVAALMLVTSSSVLAYETRGTTRTNVNSANVNRNTNVNTANVNRNTNVNTRL